MTVAPKQRSDMLYIACSDLGGEEIAAVEVAANERLDSLVRAIALQSPHPGHWELLLPDGKGGGSRKSAKALTSSLSGEVHGQVAAYDLGNAKADVTVRGTVYEVTLQGAQLQQRQKNDPTRTRQVRRVPAAALFLSGGRGVSWLRGRPLGDGTGDRGRRWSSTVGAC